DVAKFLGMKGAAEALEGVAQGIQGTIEEIIASQNKDFDELLQGANQVAKGFGGVSDEAKKTGEAINTIPNEKNIAIAVETKFDGPGFASELKKTTTKVVEDFNRGNAIIINGEVDIEATRLLRAGQKAKGTLTGAISPLAANVDIDKDAVAKFKIQAGIIEKSFEFSAKINIAEIEAGAKVAAAAFASIGQSFVAATGQISGILGAFVNADAFEQGTIERTLREQLEIQRALADSQVKLTDAQSKYLRIKADKLDKGDSLITITADGLQAELEAFMWKILERIQIRATADQAEFLLGI
ncbi:MAG: hypothetical protein Q8P44_03975, partial [Dehalococcoidia bacterium]|nr:hypothetical protein [Dehalococcoidia bacterium]